MKKEDLQQLIGSSDSVQFRLKTLSDCYEMASSLCYLEAIDFSDYEKGLEDLDFNGALNRRINLLSILLAANVERMESMKRIVDPAYIEPRIKVLRSAVDHMAGHFQVLPSEQRSANSIPLTRAMEILVSSIYRYEAFMEESMSYLSSLSGVNDTLSGARDPIKKRNLSIFNLFETWRERNSQYLNDVSGNHKSIQVEREVMELEEAAGEAKVNLYNEDYLRNLLPKKVKESVANGLAQQAKKELQNQNNDQGEAKRQAPLFGASVDVGSDVKKEGSEKKVRVVSSSSQLADIDDLLSDEPSRGPTLGP